jgi:hypothetical protein
MLRFECTFARRVTRCETQIVKLKFKPPTTTDQVTNSTSTYLTNLLTHRTKLHYTPAFPSALRPSREELLSRPPAEGALSAKERLFLCSHGNPARFASNRGPCAHPRSARDPGGLLARRLARSELRGARSRRCAGACCLRTPNPLR